MGLSINIFVLFQQEACESLFVNNALKGSSMGYYILHRRTFYSDGTHSILEATICFRIKKGAVAKQMLYIRYGF